MQVKIVDNVTRSMASVLVPLVAESQDIRMAVAFVSRRGLALINDAVRTALDRGATFEFLVGLDLRTTEPDALDMLYGLSKVQAGVGLYCYASLAAESVYHPKLYLLAAGQQASCIVGSSNLTNGGLKKNVECNILLEGQVREEPLSDAYETYARLKFHPKRVVPDGEFLAMYRRLCEQEKRDRRAKGTSSGQLLQEFEEKVGSLRRPVPTARDLVGWLQLVFDSLPEGEFTNADVYAFEGQFRRFYPENLNVKAKVRQQLQVLRDLSFIEHVGTGRWRKVGH